MKTYEGERVMEGVRVTVNSAPLPMRDDIHTYSRRGFEWGFVGPGPQQLALALLADHLGDSQRAQALARPFMRKVVSQFANAWRIESDDIDAGLREIGSSD
jgi:hypothetical protein